MLKIRTNGWLLRYSNTARAHALLLVFIDFCSAVLEHRLSDDVPLSPSEFESLDDIRARAYTFYEKSIRKRHERCRRNDKVLSVRVGIVHFVQDNAWKELSSKTFGSNDVALHKRLILKDHGRGGGGVDKNSLKVNIVRLESVASRFDALNLECLLIAKVMAESYISGHLDCENQYLLQPGKLPYEHHFSRQIRYYVIFTYAVLPLSR